MTKEDLAILAEWAYSGNGYIQEAAQRVVEALLQARDLVRFLSLRSDSRAELLENFPWLKETDGTADGD